MPFAGPKIAARPRDACAGVCVCIEGRLINAAGARACICLYGASRFRRRERERETMESELLD